MNSNQESMVCHIFKGYQPPGKNYKTYEINCDELGTFKTNVFEQPLIELMDSCIGDEATLLIRKTQKKEGFGFWYNVDDCTPFEENTVTHEKVLEKVREPAQDPQRQMQEHTAPVQAEMSSDMSYKMSIQTSTKGFHTWKVTVMAKNYDQLECRSAEAVNLAARVCDKRNLALTPEQEAEMKDLEKSAKELEELNKVPQ